MLVNPLLSLYGYSHRSKGHYIFKAVHLHTGSLDRTITPPIVIPLWWMPHLASLAHWLVCYYLVQPKEETVSRFCSDATYTTLWNLKETVKGATNMPCEQDFWLLKCSELLVYLNSGKIVVELGLQRWQMQKSKKNLLMCLITLFWILVLHFSGKGNEMQQCSFTALIMSHLKSTGCHFKSPAFNNWT